MKSWSVVLLAALTSAPCLAADVRVLVSIGNNLGDPTDEPLEHAERDAERYASVFIDIGHVASSRAMVVLGQPAQVVRERLAEVIGRVKELTSAGDVVSLFVFVSGHAKGGEFHLSGTHLPMQELRALVDGSGARFKLVVVDACDSGAISRAKGGAAAPEFTVRLEPQSVRGSVYVSSSGPAEASQEFSSLKGSLFTHHWLTGLRGDADIDGDGRVSLGEAYTYGFRRTVAGSAGAGQHPTFDFDTAGTGDVTLSLPKEARSSIVFPSNLEGSFVVISQPRPDVVAEVEKVAGRVIRLAVTPGRYVVRKRLGMQVGLVTFDLAFGGERVVDERTLTYQHFAEVVSKGSAFELHPHALLVEGAFETEQLAGAGARWAPMVSYRYAEGSLAVAAGLRVTGGRSHALGLTTDELNGVVRGSVCYRMLSWAVIPFAGLAVEGRVVHQSYRREGEDVIQRVFGVAGVPSRTTFGASLGVVLGMEVPLAERWLLTAAVDGLGRWLPAVGQSSLTFGLSAHVGAGVRW